MLFATFDLVLLVRRIIHCNDRFDYTLIHRTVTQTDNLLRRVGADPDIHRLLHIPTQQKDYRRRQREAHETVLYIILLNARARHRDGIYGTVFTFHSCNRCTDNE